MFGKEKKMVAPLLGAPGVKLTNSTLRQNLTNAELQFSSIEQLYEKFSPDAMLPFMDLTVEAEALGLTIYFPENDNPSIKEHPIKDMEGFEYIKKKWKGLNGRMSIFTNVMEKMAKTLPSSVMKIGYVIGPMTLVGELMNVADASVATVENPDLIEKMLDFTVEIISEYANALFDAGADAIAVLEPSAVLLSPRSYKKNSIRPFKNIFDNVNNKPLILHICGNTKHLIKGMCETGAFGLSLDAPMNFPELAKQIPNNIYLIGNVDPVQILLNGTVEDVKKETMTFVKKMAGIDNFILSSGCDIAIGTPLENIDAFMNVGNMWKRGLV